MRATRATLLIAVAALACALAAPALAQDRADIDRTQIIGNRELPKVLYIVPWKKPLPGDLAGRPLGERARRSAGTGGPRRVPPPGALRRASRRRAPRRRAAK